jgi:hypothetical protein
MITFKSEILISSVVINRAAANESGIDAWYATKGGSLPPEGTTCKWHSPSQPEVKLAEELVNLHLQGSLQDLRSICQDGPQTDISGRATFVWCVFSLFFLWTPRLLSNFNSFGRWQS